MGYIDFNKSCQENAQMSNTFTVIVFLKKKILQCFHMHIP